MAELSPGTVVDGRYEIVGPLGAGGMSRVYRARQVALNREVALKFLQRHLAGERLRREAKILARLRHPHVVAIFDYGQCAEAGDYIAMELVAGRSLAEELKLNGAFPPQMAVRLVSEICSAVHAAHQEGVIHRDLKPSNVMLEGEEARVKVLDFGIATTLDASGLQGSRGDRLAGTPKYLAPELANGGEPDARSDVYALGCIAFEMLVGHAPFERSSAAAMLVAHLGEAPLSPASQGAPVEPGVDAAILKALVKDPLARYESAAAFASALEGALVGIAPVLEARDLPGNLPQEVSTFIGREAEIEEVIASYSDSPVLTLTGPGGIGKTRLARRVGAAFPRLGIDRAGDGIWFVDFAPLTSDAHVVGAINTVFGFREVADRDPRDVLCDALRPKRLLLVLDNCEHVVDAVASIVAAIVRTAPGVTVLATSREPLGVQGERVTRVQGLSLGENVDEGLSEAAQLFVSRARIASDSFSCEGEQSELIESLCAQLEGIPLAIELAAARARVITVTQMLERLGARFRLLSSGKKQAGARQHTLREAIDWSYDLLSDDERLLFRSLSVFIGGCSLPAVEAVIGDEEIDVLDTLGRLVDKSLVVATEVGGESRYRMLETIREYAAERLDHEEPDGLLGRFVTWAVNLCEDYVAGWNQNEERRYLDLLDRESDNVRAAISYSFTAGGDLESALRMCSNFHVVWVMRGRLREGTRYVKEALERSAEMRTYGRNRVLIAGAWLAGGEGDYPRMKSLSLEALRLAHERDDVMCVQRALETLGESQLVLGEFDEGAAAFEECYELRKQLGLRRAMVSAGFGAAHVAHVRGNVERAYELFELSLCDAREQNNYFTAGRALHLLAQLDRAAGNLDLSDARLDECEAIAEGLMWKHCIAYIVTQRMASSATRSDLPAARAYFAKCLDMLVELGDDRGIVDAFETYAYVSRFGFEPESAVRLYGAAMRMREEQGRELYPADVIDKEAFMSYTESTLGAERRKVLLDEGTGLSNDQALALARTLAAVSS